MLSTSAHMRKFRCSVPYHAGPPSDLPIRGAVSWGRLDYSLVSWVIGCRDRSRCLGDCFVGKGFFLVSFLQMGFITALSGLSKLPLPA